MRPKGASPGLRGQNPRPRSAPSGRGRTAQRAPRSGRRPHLIASPERGGLMSDATDAAGGAGGRKIPTTVLIYVAAVLAALVLAFTGTKDDQGFWVLGAAHI